MDQAALDLKREQQASRERPRYRYSLLTRALTRGMDMFAGEETTLAKAKLIESLATVPYRAWERRVCTLMAQREYQDARSLREAHALVKWAREAQDNERWHLLVINEKLAEDGAATPRYLTPPLPSLIVAGHRVMSWFMARISLRRAYILNAEFEDHAEHTYAQLVEDHPEWESQPVTSEVVREYGAFDSWADVFRRIGLDERDHMNNSFIFGGHPEHTVYYDGMPETPAAPAPQ